MNDGRYSLLLCDLGEASVSSGLELFLPRQMDSQNLGHRIGGREGEADDAVP